MSSRITKLRLDDALTHTTNFLEWVATASVQDTNEGQSVVTTIVRSTGGTPPGDPASLTLRYTTDTGTIIRTVTLDTTAASQTDTFFFTNNGASGGPARCGTVELKLQATRTDAVAYDVETDGSPNTPPTAFDSHLERGWIRGLTTAQTFLSNLAFGGGKNLPFTYDDSLFHRVVLSSAPFKTETITHATAPDVVTGTSTSATATFDRQFINVVDNRFPSTQVTESATVSFPNSSLSGIPWTAATVTQDTALFDPRITIGHLLQLNDSSYGTPPVSKVDADDTREVTKLGFLAFRLTNARNEGINGIASSQEIRDIALLLTPGNYPSRTGVTTVTQGGEIGWALDFMVWEDALPEGTWTHKITLTTADAVGLEFGNTKNYTLKGSAPVFDPIAFAISDGKVISYK